MAFCLERQGEISLALQLAQQSAGILGPLSAANPGVAAYKKIRRRRAEHAR